jgi:hypothetical protein
MFVAHIEQLRHEEGVTDLRQAVSSPDARIEYRDEEGRSRHDTWTWNTISSMAQRAWRLSLP